MPLEHCAGFFAPADPARPKLAAVFGHGAETALAG
jgi:hypothetical protein